MSYPPTHLNNLQWDVTAIEQMADILNMQNRAMGLPEVWHTVPEENSFCDVVLYSYSTDESMPGRAALYFQSAIEALTWMSRRASLNASTIHNENFRAPTVEVAEATFGQPISPECYYEREGANPVLVSDVIPYKL